MVMHNFSGGSFNPIRAFAPAFLEMGGFSSADIVLFTAPFAGALLAALLHAVVFTSQPGFPIGFAVPDNWSTEKKYIGTSLHQHYQH
jgi:hypothetical protein